MSGLRRRFVNLLALDALKRVRTLRRFDLSRNQFFYPSSVEAAAHAKVVPSWTPANAEDMAKTAGKTRSKANKENNLEKIEMIRPPAAVISLKPGLCPTTPVIESKLDCFPLSENKIFFADRSTRIFRFDADHRCVVTMPNLHTPKYSPLSLSVPAPGRGADEDDEDDGQGLYIIERLLKPEMGPGQFEALRYRERHETFNMGKAWHCETLPLPPFVHTPGYKPASICSYAVVGSNICISTRGVGTYSFNTVSHEWSHAGDWLMPFYGKAEYVPELNLWFGVSASNYHLPCAADISGVITRKQPLPEHTHVWAYSDLPEEWQPRPCCPAKVVNLGSGRFCIANFFQTMERNTILDELYVDQAFAVFSGVEVLVGNGGNGNGLRMIKYKSRRCRIHNSNMIEAVL